MRLNVYVSILAPYGFVLEGGIFVDHGWFDDTGYAILQIPSEGDIPELTHELSWNDESQIYAAWTAMPLHCSYCHKPNHSKLDCPTRTALRCWTCLATGHLRVHCPKRIQTNHTVHSPKSTSKSTCKSTSKSKTKKKTSPIVPAPHVNKRSPPSSDSETDPLPVLPSSASQATATKRRRGHGG